MLVVTRKEQESVIITDTRTGEEIKVILVNMYSNAVRIGVEASHDYKILREELKEKE
jgi:carbon storage regulator CsrA